MGDTVDMNSYVHHGDILAAIRTIYGPQAKLLEYQSDHANASVQGFTSLMLRVKVQVQVTSTSLQPVTCSLIVKRLPAVEAPEEIVKQVSGIFHREITYFNVVIPILQSKCPNLALVKCHTAHGTTLVMEDLCASGFNTLGSSMADVDTNLVGLSHMRMAVRKLAQIHASSLETDWQKLLPQIFESDVVFDAHPINFFAMLLKNGAEIASTVIKSLYPDEKYTHYSTWLKSNECFQKMKSFIKPSSKILNVLNHGDCWANNMMFKLDPKTKEPLDIKFIDLQVFRFAPPTIDLQYFMYSCTTKKFREENEENILRAYIESFNATLCKTPDILNYGELFNYFDETRMFGVLYGMIMRPMKYMAMEIPGDKIEGEKSEGGTDQSIKVLKLMNINSEFKELMTEVVEELIHVMDRAKVV